MDLNLPSINVPTMPGTITVTRTATNVSNKAYNYVVSVDPPDRGTIRVSPSSGKIKPGQSQTFEITIKSNAPTGQYFGQINLLSTTGIPPLHLPGRVLQPAGQRDDQPELHADDRGQGRDDHVHGQAAEHLVRRTPRSWQRAR